MMKGWRASQGRRKSGCQSIHLGMQRGAGWVPDYTGGLVCSPSTVSQEPSRGMGTRTEGKDIDSRAVDLAGLLLTKWLTLLFICNGTTHMCLSDTDE